MGYKLPQKMPNSYQKAQLPYGSQTSQPLVMPAVLVL
jgi:hypothetical protein